MLENVVVRFLGHLLSDGFPKPVIFLGQDWFLLKGI